MRDTCELVPPKGASKQCWIPFWQHLKSIRVSRGAVPLGAGPTSPSAHHPLGPTV